jgi:predicted ribosome quality control (RQC) complex YloA/Tae2 family protein
MRVSIENYFANIGKSAKENWQLLDNAEQCDIWFHVDNASSPYVILEIKNLESIPTSVISECAKLCKSGSKNKNDSNISIIYTTVSNLKKGKLLGSVYLTKAPTKISI